MSQLRKQAGQGEDPFGSGQSQTQEQAKFKPLGLIPDIHDLMQQGGIQDSKEAREARKRGKRPLCCCGVPGCKIGPMTQVQDEDKDEVERR